MLIVDEAHDGRPTGADPWDIRDHVNWIRPVAVLKENDQVAARAAAARNPAAWQPALTGFKLAEADRNAIELRPHWAKTRGFAFAVVPTNEETMNNNGITFERTVPITMRNAWMQVSVGYDVARRHHHVIVAADGTEIPSSVGTRLYDGARTLNRGGFDNRSYSLAKFLDTSPKFTLRLAPDQKKASQSGTEFDVIVFGPLIVDLPADGKPLQAQVPLPPPIKKNPEWKPEWKWEPGKTYDGKPLVIRGLPFAAGNGMLHGTTATFSLDPSYKRFVALLGVCDGGGDVVGPIEILLDDEPFWKSNGKFDSRAAAQQIDLFLPAEHKTLTIRTPAANGVLGLGNAGFMTE
ncbi:MAG: NPCBM/NEW2 domain-containing protein [Pirellulales bacterium]